MCSASYCGIRRGRVHHSHAQMGWRQRQQRCRASLCMSNTDIAHINFIGSRVRHTNAQLPQPFPLIPTLI